MADLAEIWIFDADAVSREALAAFIETHDTYRDFCRVESPAAFEAHEARAVIVLGDVPEALDIQAAAELAKPVRVGAVLDTFDKIMKKQDRFLDAEDVVLGPWQLDPVHNVLQHQDEKQSVRLTDKEKEILLLLHAHRGEPVTREDMLKTVWGFVDGVETHTLETHIYRLRQKIEDDPAAPEILLTMEEGYILGKT